MNVLSLSKYYKSILLDTISKFCSHRILLILIAGLLIRIALFDTVAVNADIGLYLYDARSLATGQIPMVDYPSRSPLFLALLSLVMQSGLDPLTAARGLMIVNALLGGFGVYRLTTALADQRSGEYAAAIFLFVPLSLFWGMWLKTETVLVVLLVHQLARFTPQLDHSNVPTKELLLMGFVLGAGFLIRRTALFYALTIAIVYFYYRVRSNNHLIFKETAAVGIMGFSTLSTILIGYLGISRGDLAATAELTGKHLFDSLGFSTASLTESHAIFLLTGFLILTVASIFVYKKEVRGNTSGLKNVEPLVLISSVVVWMYFFLLSTPQFQSCLVCSPREWQIVAEIGYVSLPIFLFIMFIIGKGLPRISAKTSNENIRKIVVGTFYGLLLWIVYWFLNTLYGVSLPFHEYHIPGLLTAQVGALTLFAILIFIRAPELNWKENWSAEHTLVLTIVVAISLIYLYRDRVLFIGYAQEILPFVSVFIGIGIAIITRQSSKLTKNGVLSILLLAVILGSLASPVIISNVGGIVQPYNPDQGTVTSLQEAGEIIENQTPEDGVIFTAQPIYALQSDRTNLGDFSRQFWQYKYSDGDQNMTNTIVEGLQNQRADAIVIERRGRIVLRESPQIEDAFRQNYCWANDPAIEKVNAELYLPQSSGC